MANQFEKSSVPTLLSEIQNLDRLLSRKERETNPKILLKLKELKRELLQIRDAMMFKTLKVSGAA